MMARWAVGWAAACACAWVAGCARDMADSFELAEPPGHPPAMVTLAPIDLADHAGFDRLDRAVGGPGADLVKVYNDLARLAPGSSLVLVRGALAALAADGSDKGRAVALGVLRRLSSRAGDPDVAFLGIALGRSFLLGTDGTVRVSAGDLDTARKVVEEAAAFQASNPGWVGPGGVTASRVAAIGHEVEAAIARS